MNKLRLAKLEQKLPHPPTPAKLSAEKEAQFALSVKLLEKLTRQNIAVANGDAVWNEIQALFLFGDDPPARA
jgi:hypothetical protein